MEEGVKNFDSISDPSCATHHYMKHDPGTRSLCLLLVIFLTNSFLMLEKSDITISCKK